MRETKTTDEPRQIEATVGPFAGQRLTVSPADADAAIAEGWARDPFAEVDPEAKPKELTDEERQKVAEAAQKAARRLRGEDAADEAGKEPANKAMSAEEEPEYRTRGTPPRPRR